MRDAKEHTPNVDNQLTNESVHAIHAEHNNVQAKWKAYQKLHSFERSSRENMA